MLPLLLLLLQTATLEDSVAAYVKGDEKVREDILKAGACAILPLRKARDRAPEKIDALQFEIKKAVAGFDLKPLLGALEARRSVELGETEFFAAVSELSTDFPLVFDPALFRTHDGRKVKFTMKNRSRQELLEELCRQTDLDWGFFYGVLLLGSPARLWPGEPPPRVTPLTAEESRRAAAWIDQLSDEQVDRREEAIAALKKLGEGAIPILERVSEGRDAEKAARVRDLIAHLRRPPPMGIFHPPGAERQKLAGADRELMKSLQENQVSFKAGDIDLQGAMTLLLAAREVRFNISPAAKEPRVTLDIQNQSAWVVVSVATHSSGFDFMIVGREVVIDTREAIGRRLGFAR